MGQPKPSRTIQPPIPSRCCKAGWRALSADGRSGASSASSSSLAHHGGHDNGELLVINRDFVALWRLDGDDQTGARGGGRAWIHRARRRLRLQEPGLCAAPPGSASCSSTARGRCLIIPGGGASRPTDEAKLAGEGWHGLQLCENERPKLRAMLRQTLLESRSTGPLLHKLKQRWVSSKSEATVPQSESGALSTVSEQGGAPPPAGASAAQSSRPSQPPSQARAERTPAAAIQPDADETEPSQWSHQPPEPTP